MQSFTAVRTNIPGKQMISDFINILNNLYLHFCNPDSTG